MKLFKYKQFIENFSAKDFFLTISKETHPHGYEDELISILPSLEKDEYGNYYKIVGNPHIMFTAHLDTADDIKKTVNHKIENNKDGEIISTDGSSILGADNKAGVTVLTYMINSNVEGLYYFFIGEERGRLGSITLANNFKNIDYLNDIDSCVSFDRKGTSSVITHQMGIRCCSDAFAMGICDELGKNGLDFILDNTGIFTDSLSFINLIPECTNISVGYENEHTELEKLDITFLDKLCKAVVNINWDKLPINRKI